MCSVTCRTSIVSHQKDHIFQQQFVGPKMSSTRCVSLPGIVLFLFIRQLFLFKIKDDIFFSSNYNTLEIFDKKPLHLQNKSKLLGCCICTFTISTLFFSYDLIQFRLNSLMDPALSGRLSSGFGITLIIPKNTQTLLLLVLLQLV